jgi:glycosyltransferase involved in cell wall biosynthesis
MQHVFREIVDEREVVWINGIGHRMPGLSRADLKRAWEKGVAMLGVAGPSANGGRLGGREPRVIVHPRVLPWHGRASVRAINRWSLSRSIRSALDSIGADGPPVLVTGSPPSAPLIGHLGELAAVYFCMDDFSHLAGVSSRMLEGLERELLSSVDAVVATARTLTRSKMPRSGEAHYLPQGVNYDHFATPLPEPDEIRSLPRPIVGFAGGVSACCDLPLIRRLAEEHPDGSVLLVGPVNVDVGELDLPNIHILGARPYSVLPAYVQRFDVGLIPYVLNEWTRAVDPLKLLEYLAAGVPVVSTEIPEVLKYRDAVRIGGDRDSFVREVAGALAEDGERSRLRGQELARKNTWAHRARTLLDVVDAIVERGSRPVGVS